MNALGALAFASAFALAALALDGTAHAQARQGAQSTQQGQKESGAISCGGEPAVPMLDLVRRYFEPSYVAYPYGISGLPPLILESDIAPHFVVGRRAWPVAFVLTPKILLRMFRERSTPVRTPSYMPRISVYAWLTRELSPHETAVYASLSLSHHSNGQSGHARNADGSNNHLDGDFSTNFLELALYETRAGATLFGWNQLAFEWHLDINRSAGLAGRYGLLRLHFATTLLTTDAPLEGALTAQLIAILDDFERESHARVLRTLERFPISLQYTVKVPGIDLGAYVGYYLGHDYLNIWFDRVIHTVQVGISGTIGPVLQ
jgi:hypothetical protein